MYERTMVAGWGDMDFNAHMRNTAYMDKAADIRFMFFADHGFPMAEFSRLRLGPVVMKDEVEYFRECRLLDALAVRMELSGLSEDGTRMRIRNEIYREGVLAARVTSTAGWFDLAARKLAAPPPALMEVLRAIPRTEDFEVLPGSVRAGDA
ncbi:thioesterase [Massilia arenosa]|uniref:Thioesterase n=1 Tax=Zemynaea arenosa TaxID=2561931 RepID=A0A4Y9S787_9BURK|nr:thioesterase family protein [Massilia arenosa]TFW17455.1 thioesterase [Massilia arenosa]